VHLNYRAYVAGVNTVSHIAVVNDKLQTVYTALSTLRPYITLYKESSDRLP